MGEVTFNKIVLEKKKNLKMEKNIYLPKNWNYIK